MTKAEEKANELIEMFKPFAHYVSEKGEKYNAKQIAILHCQEVIDNMKELYFKFDRSITVYQEIQFYAEVIEILKSK